MAEKLADYDKNSDICTSKMDLVPPIAGIFLRQPNHLHNRIILTKDGCLKRFRKRN